MNHRKNIINSSQLPESAIARFGKGIIHQIKFSPDRAILAVASSIGIWIYDTETYQEIALLMNQTDDVMSIAFSPDGRTLASGSLDKTICIWDVNSEQLKTRMKLLESVASIAFNSDGTTLASGERNRLQGGAIHLWDATTGQHRRTLMSGTEGWIREMSVVFSPDGTTVAGIWNDTIRLWDATTGETRKTLTSHGCVSSIAFSPESTLIASARSKIILLTPLVLSALLCLIVPYFSAFWNYPILVPFMFIGFFRLFVTQIRALVRIFDFECPSSVPLGTICL